jgi:hypothetical protein
MRTMLRVTMDTETTNRAAKDGSLQKAIERLFEDLKPEAAYFTANDGRRSAMFFFDMQDSSQLPVIAEPLFQTLGARLEVQPAMNREELMTGLQKAAQRR